MTQWPRAVIVPVAIAVPFLGIATDYVTPLLLRGAATPPWRNPSSVLWSFWAVLVPLVLLVEQRRPLRRPSLRSFAAHAVTLLLIFGAQIVIGLAVNLATMGRLAPRGDLMRYIWLDPLPRHLVVDLVVYALILAVSYALRSWRS